jgi:site-specific recombinase XerD
VRGLHFHDLRREFGSRLLESGADFHDVREFLGHANITTTSRYLASTPQRLEKALSRMEHPPESEAPTTTENVALTPEQQQRVN